MTNKFQKEVNKHLLEPELDWYKSKVKEWAGEKPTSDSMMEALEKAWSGAGHARFKTDTLHNELLKTRGKSNRRRKFMKQGYYPEGNQFDPEYMKHWLHREIMGEFITRPQDGPIPFYTPR